MLGQAPKLKVGEQIREKAISKTITQQIALEKQFQQSFFGTITTTQPKVATITKTRLNNLLAETPTPPPPIPPEFPPPPPPVAFDFEKKY